MNENNVNMTSCVEHRSTGLFHARQRLDSLTWWSAVCWTRWNYTTDRQIKAQLNEVKKLPAHTSNKKRLRNELYYYILVYYYSFNA